jgi:glycosyltransferase involved in cell wall biosynthesis
MRVLLVAQTWGARNGPGVFSARLAHGLAAAGHRVVAIVPADALRTRHERAAPVEQLLVRSLPLAPGDVRVTLGAQGPVAHALKAFRPDVVHIQDHYPLCAVAARLAQAYGAPLVGTNHFLPENVLPRIPFARRAAARRALHAALWCWVRRVFRRAQRLAAPSTFAAEVLRRQCPGVPVETLSNGVDLERFRPRPWAERARMRLRYGLDPTAVVCAYLGRLDAEKRVDTLLEAVARLRQPRLQLALLGCGAAEKMLRRQAARLGLGTRAVFTGFVPDADLPALLAAADMFAMPSGAELQSLATLEAMACALPVLAADTGALPELVVPGATGELFRAGDVEDAARGLAALLDAQRRSRLGAGGSASAQRHALPATVERYLELYERSMASAAASRSAHIRVR